MKKSFHAAALVLASVGLAACGEEPGVYAMTPEQLGMKLSSATKNYKPSANGAVQTISGASLVEDGVKVALSSSNGREYSRSCLIRFEAVDAASTRVNADCDRGAGSSSQSRTMEELDEAAVMEFVASSLDGRDFDYTRVLAKQTAVMAKNHKDNVNEALENYDRAQSGVYEDDPEVEAMFNAAAEQIELQDAGWGDQ
ncbi:hypothetical protein K3152_03760 [Qipengyuania sp. 1NDH17]|uniref:Lipoprotein n=1 Tax=Qipengyuania polymorpha TaxID=2867234 RepID=A0ABS7IV75_9SPHN|nr:hypothetical protein [Qipengyuania polymorpha]MBX7457354.1 hypothetical protein [Qipengyuania polymorpha]